MQPKYKAREVESGDKLYTDSVEEIRAWLEQWDEDTDGDFRVIIKVLNPEVGKYRYPTDAEYEYLNSATGYYNI